LPAASLRFSRHSLLMPRVFALVALAVFAWPAWSSEQAALETIQACRDQVDDETYGLDDLEKSCPGVKEAIGALRLDERLQADWEDEIGPAMLNDLAVLQLRYDSEPASPGPRVDAVHEALAKLKPDKASVEPSWWEKFKAWLHEVFTPRDAETPEWLQGVLEKLTPSQAVMRVIFYSIIGLVIGLALAVVLNELRVAGVFGRRFARRGGEYATGSGMAIAPVTLADLDAAPWFDRPSLALRLLVARLLQQQRLRAERSLTHRELLREARFANETERERFARLALLAETLKFGDRAARGAVEEKAEDAVAGARALLSEWALQPAPGEQKT